MGSTYSTPTGKVTRIKISNKDNNSYLKNKVVKDPRELFLRDQIAFNNKQGNKKRNYKIKERLYKKYNLDMFNLTLFKSGVLLPIEAYKPEKFD
jgi:hypothetical protein